MCGRPLLARADEAIRGRGRAICSRTLVALITSLAARYRLPAVYPYRLFAEVGGLLSYGNDVFDNYRRAATYADRILKGDKPSELPVQAPRQVPSVAG
jgi:ABC-type uncharacterized transport system substrate-binding protein